jgi:uncharacterized protein (DUF3084 family)
MNETPTPETDALYRDDHRPNLIEHARRLERERDEAREAAEHYRNLYYLPKDGLEAAKNHPLSWENAKAQEELATVTEQRDRLAEALKACREDSAELLGERDWWQAEPRCDYQKRWQDTHDNLTRADETLQSLTPKL